MSAERSAWVFPGQNSVEEGMGKRLYESYAQAREVFKAADRILGFGITEICVDGSLRDLQSPHIAQPALVATSIAYLAVLKVKNGAEIDSPGMILGHSTGEYSGLVAARSLLFADALRISHQRGQYLEDEAIEHPTSMIVVLGLVQEKINQICSFSGAEIANVNSNKQMVLAGTTEAISVAERKALDLRGRVLNIGINVGSHFSGAKPVAEKLARLLKEVHIEPPKIPIIANATTDYVSTAYQVRKSLVDQLTHTVHWLNMVLKARKDGAVKFSEIGPKATLTGLIKRIAQDSGLEVSAHSSEELLWQQEIKE